MSAASTISTASAWSGVGVGTAEMEGIGGQPTAARAVQRGGRDGTGRTTDARSIEAATRRSPGGGPEACRRRKTKRDRSPRQQGCR